MRFAMVTALACAAFVKAAPAAPITFSGYFEGNLANAYDFGLTGTDGFSAGGSLSDDSLAFPMFCGNPCNASSIFSFAPFSSAELPSGWSASFEGQSLREPVIQTLPNGTHGAFPTAAIGGDIQYTVPAFVPCAGCTLSVPATYSGEIWVKFLPDGPYLYDLAIAGSGTMDIAIRNPGPSEYFVYGISADITGTATPIPEPGTIVLMFAGAIWLLGKVARCAGAVRWM